MLKQRVLTAVIAVVILLSILFYAPPVVARVAIGALFVAAAWEWSQFLGDVTVLVRGLFVGLVVAAEILLGLVFTDPTLHLYILFVALAWWLVALAWTFYFPTPIPRAAAWLCGFLVLIPAYVALQDLYTASPWLLLSLLMIVWIADIGAYFFGRAFGRRKLAPRVSPGKTWEGVFGGLTFSLVAAGVVTVLFSKISVAVLPFCAAVVLVSIVGDLTVSMFKRHTGLKDSGKLFPGHGGVLDRVDSVCAAAPVFAAGTRVLGLV